MVKQLSEKPKKKRILEKTSGQNKEKRQKKENTSSTKNVEKTITETSKPRKRIAIVKSSIGNKNVQKIGGLINIMYNEKIPRVRYLDNEYFIQLLGTLSFSIPNDWCATDKTCVQFSSYRKRTIAPKNSINYVSTSFLDRVETRCQFFCFCLCIKHKYSINIFKFSGGKFAYYLTNPTTGIELLFLKKCYVTLD